jgi:hypothetical protein
MLAIPSLLVIPAEAGIQRLEASAPALGPRFRGGDVIVSGGV